MRVVRDVTSPLSMARRRDQYVHISRIRHQGEHRTPPVGGQGAQGEEFKVVNRRARALGDTGNGSGLHQVAGAATNIHQPVRYHPAALSAQRRNRDSDGPNRAHPGDSAPMRARCRSKRR
jgi:hypothetical protein